MQRSPSPDPESTPLTAKDPKWRAALDKATSGYVKSGLSPGESLLFLANSYGSLVSTFEHYAASTDEEIAQYKLQLRTNSPGFEQRLNSLESKMERLIGLIEGRLP